MLIWFHRSRSPKGAPKQYRWRRPLTRSSTTGRGHGRSARRRERNAGARLQGEGADQLVTRIDPGVVSLVAELSGHERQAAEELGQWKTHVEERRVIDPAPAEIV